VHNPRKIIDVCADAPHSEEDAKVKEVRRFKQLLVEIEQVSLHFLDMKYCNQLFLYNIFMKLFPIGIFLFYRAMIFCWILMIWKKEHWLYQKKQGIL